MQELAVPLTPFRHERYMECRKNGRCYVLRERSVAQARLYRLRRLG